MTCLRNAAKWMWLWWLKSELPTQKRCRQKEQDAKARISYLRSSRPAWATGDLLKQITKEIP